MEDLEGPKSIAFAIFGAVVLVFLATTAYSFYTAPVPDVPYGTKRQPTKSIRIESWTWGKLGDRLVAKGSVVGLSKKGLPGLEVAVRYSDASSSFLVAISKPLGIRSFERGDRATFSMDVPFDPQVKKAEIRFFTKDGRRWAF